MNRKLLIIDVAALGYSLLAENSRTSFAGLDFKPAESVFPAVTCAVQGSFRTATCPSQHGMIANGLYLPDLHRVMFWEQSADLVKGDRIWKTFRKQGGRVGMLFWQQSLGEEVDLILSPAPVHKHGGGILMDCAAKPASLYKDLCKTIGGRFPLHRYWGPLASTKSGDWIAEATCRVMADSAIAPELLMTYIPSLDYDLQRHGPGSRKAKKAVEKTLSQIDKIVSAARAGNYEVVVFGDYCIGNVTGPVSLPNLALRQNNLLDIREISGRDYPDFHNSSAFAVADHEIAHVYVKESYDIPAVQKTLASLEEIETVLDRSDGVDNPRAGELLAIAREGSWIAYPWWKNKKNAPDYASHVDIHNKPGYDPCELYFGTLPIGVSMDTSRISGSHGRTGPGREVAWASTVDMGSPESIIELSSCVKAWLEGA